MEGALRRPRVVGEDHFRVAAGVLILMVTIAALAVAAARTIPGGVPSEVQLTDRDDGGSVRLARGGSLVVALVSNPSTGYAWKVSDRSGSGLVLVGPPRYVPPGSTAPVIGAPGTEVFRFDATMPGAYELVLEYRRGFEPSAPPERTFRVIVEID